MKKNNGSGRFIVVEGPNGSGKSTLIQALEAEVRRRGLQVQRTREPGGTPFGEDIRPIAKSCYGRVGGLAAALLFNAARADNCAKVIEPAIAAGQVVMCDRWTLSTVVYQCILGGMPPEHRAAVAAVHSVQTIPDLTIVVIPSPETIRQRLAGVAREGDSFEATGAAVEVEAYRTASCEALSGSVLVVEVGPTDTPADVLARVIRSPKYSAVFEALCGE